MMASLRILFPPCAHPAPLYLRRARHAGTRCHDRLAGEGGVSVADSVELTHYRLVEGASANLRLAGSGSADPVVSIRGDATGHAGAGEVPMGLLGELVEMFNERFGAHLSDIDAVRPVRHLIDKAAEIGEDEGLRAQAIGNSFEDFERGKEDVILNATLQVQDIKDLILKKLLDDESVRSQMTHLVMRSLYDRLHRRRAGSLNPPLPRAVEDCS